MGEIWIAAVVTVGGGVIAGIGAEKKDKSDKAHEEKMTKESAALTAQQTGYESALENYYKQKDRFETQRGLDQFRQFSTLDQFAPGVDDQGGRVAAPVTPEYNSFAPTTPQQGTTPTGGGGKSFIEKIDPLGSKILGGLF
jgi:hypothetical protein